MSIFSKKDKPVGCLTRWPSASHRRLRRCPSPPGQINMIVILSFHSRSFPKARVFLAITKNSLVPLPKKLPLSFSLSLSLTMSFWAASPWNLLGESLLHVWVMYHRVGEHQHLHNSRLAFGVLNNVLIILVFFLVDGVPTLDKLMRSSSWFIFLEYWETIKQTQPKICTNIAT